MLSKEARNWESLFMEQEGSGETVSAFCSRRGISYHSFKNRKTRWNQRRKESGGVVAAADFIEVTSENKAIVKVELKNGRRLEVPSNFQESSIRRLIGVLESC